MRESVMRPGLVVAVGGKGRTGVRRNAQDAWFTERDLEPGRALGRR